MQTFVSAGQVLATVGVAGSPRTGVIDVSALSSSSAFFGLVSDQSTSSGAKFPPPAGMVLIPAGTFVMGSPDSDMDRDSGETQHTVTLTKDFYMSKYEVTQKEYLAVMGNNPSSFTSDLNRPVERVSWNDALSYCAKLTASEKSAGRLSAGWVYRLPTEAEWEYACRAGTTTAFYFGKELRSVMANFNDSNGTYLARTSAVGSYQPNAFGLYDMHGNVSEWCLDRFESFLDETVTDPLGPATGPFRMVRGGNWGRPAKHCRSAMRGYDSPSDRSSYIGFRPVLAPGQP